MTQYSQVNLFIDKLQNKAISGEPVNLYELQREAGYTHYSAKSYKGINNETYKQRMKPFISQLKAERERILKAMQGKDLEHEQYKDLDRALQNQTKVIQLLGGQATENIEYRIKRGSTVYDVEPEESTESIDSTEQNSIEEPNKALEKSTDTKTTTDTNIGGNTSKTANKSVTEHIILNKETENSL